MEDLFKTLMKFTEQEEDFFTECLAATLREDLSLARASLETICGPEVEGVRIADSRIDIDTQVQFRGSCIDMVFNLDNNISVGVENKLWSPEGPGQLSRYLKLPLDALAFVTGYYATVSPTVLENPRYLKPAKRRDHFMWQDFYEDLRIHAERGPRPCLTDSLLGLFEHLGFAPPHPEIDDLHPDEDVDGQDKRNFAKLWEPTRQGLRERGWKTIRPSYIAELYVEQGSSKRLEWAYLDPIWQRGSLRIGLTFQEDVDLSEMASLLEESKEILHPDMEVVIAKRHRKEGLIDVVDVLVPMTKLFEGLTHAESIAQRLSDYTLAVFDIVG